MTQMKSRWDYMKVQGFNPPSLRCKEADAGCHDLSKSFLIGLKSYFREDGSRDCVVERWKCEYGHCWLDGKTMEVM